MATCNCNSDACIHTTANQTTPESVGRQFVYVGEPFHVEQDEAGVGGVTFDIPYNYNFSLATTDVVISGSPPTGLAVTIRTNAEGVTVIRTSTPVNTVFAPGTYATVFTTFGVATTVTIYGELQ